ncbi:MAG: urea ABC transporter permease subunit UrtB [bacterium]
MSEQSQVIVQVLNGISLSMILVLISLSLSIIFGLMGIINLAHGEMFMVGAYTVVAVNEFVVHSFWIGVLAAPIVVGALGLVMERSLIKRLYKRPLETLLATWGASIALRQIVKLTMGSGHKMVLSPTTGAIHLFAGVEYPAYRLMIMGITVIILASIFLFLFKTNIGLQCRTVISNRSMASALGINTAFCDSFVFALGAAVAGIAGAIMSPLITVNPEMGLSFLARSFFVVILGGLGNLFGVLGGAGIIGGAEAFFSYFISPVIAQVIVLLLAIVVIRLKPNGLFGGL